MSDKLFYRILAIVIAIGMISSIALVGYSYKLQSEASIISIVANER